MSLDRALGLCVEDFVPLASEEDNRILTRDGASYSCDLWADLVHLEGAEPLASYQQGFYAGIPAVTRLAFGNGVTYYLGTRPEERYTRLLLGQICRETGVSAPLEAQPGVEVVRRKTEEASFLFVLNHNTELAQVRLDGPVRDVLTGEKHDGALDLDPLEVAVLEETW
jgi:beta-galactosidase